MDKKLREELIRETHLEDIAESVLYVCLNMPVGMRSISRSRKISSSRHGTGGYR